MRKTTLIIATSGAIAVLAAVVGSYAQTQDKYTVAVQGGLGFAEFRGYENWALISISENGGKFAAIMGNPVMIEAYLAGVPDNGKPFPDGSRMAKIHWNPKTQTKYPGAPKVPGTQHDVDFMVKDSKRFADSGGWGWAAFEYDAKTNSFTPADMSASPPQGHDAKCGLACHTVVKGRDYVFTEYGKR
jgi:hypothetical protein